MENKRKERINGNTKENTTKYGEFVCSEYHWLPIEKQKKKAEKMANLTKEDFDRNEKK